MGVKVCGSLEHQAQERWREDGELSLGCWRRWAGLREPSRARVRKGVRPTKPECAMSRDPGELAWALGAEAACRGCGEVTRAPGLTGSSMSQS